jgi:hypothetical protein
MLDPQAWLVSSSTDAGGQIKTARWSRDGYAASANDFSGEDWFYGSPKIPTHKFIHSERFLQSLSATW